jgi:bifunctional non-homologous end joining protein LigD
VVAKRRTSRYRPGVRSQDWVKVPHRRTHSFVVGGFRVGSSPGPGRVGSLVVGSPVGDGLLALDGAAGSGLTDAMQRALRSVLDDLVVDAPPFEDAAASLPASAAGPVTWCEPIVVVDVASLGRTEQGLLRQPSVVRVRPDLTYDDLLRAEEQA